MAFYDLPPDERMKTVAAIQNHILADVQSGNYSQSTAYFSNTDTYIRKAAYLGIGRIYLAYTRHRDALIQMLESLLPHPDFKVRQTVINAAGEIGKYNFELVKPFFDTGLFDAHHSPRNAVIGSVKKMGEVNPVPVLAWAKTYLHHADKEIRREICHGIELRGRKYPLDILPLLKELEHDKTARVRNTLVHVIGQIAYKPGCLPLVLEHLKTWENKKLVSDAVEEIIDVHYRYRNFSAITQEEARNVVKGFGY
ncbi:MAG: HEAT repeat domain-containing protein [Bacteroidota bacterium]